MIDDSNTCDPLFKTVNLSLVQTLRAGESLLSERVDVIDTDI